MEFAFIVWAIGTLPSVASAFCFILFFPMLVSLVGLIILRIAQAVENFSEDDIKQADKLAGVFKWIFFPSLIFWSLFLLIPDKETAYAMAGAYGVQQVAQNERVQDLAGNGLSVLEAYLEKTKKELEKDTK